jgi:hypothetical protein
VFLKGLFYAGLIFKTESQCDGRLDRFVNEYT